MASHSLLSPGFALCLVRALSWYAAAALISMTLAAIVLVATHSDGSRWLTTVGLLGCLTIVVEVVLVVLIRQRLSDWLLRHRDHGPAPVIVPMASN